MSDRLILPLQYFLRIAERDHWICHWCDDGYRPADPWEIDHRKSLAAGGTNHMHNLGLCHHSCNRDKGALSVAS